MQDPATSSVSIQSHPAPSAIRLPEAKIKQALLYPDKLVRHEALVYFTECFSRDTEVMPLVIQALANYGRRNAFRHLHVPENLAQSEATVDWAIRELWFENPMTCGVRCLKWAR